MIASVNPRIITWARERSGLSIEDLASKVKRDPSEVTRWESGHAFPSYGMLEALAYRHLKIPLALFFFPEPPSVDDPVGKFRRLPEFELKRLSSDTRLKIRLAQGYQESLDELLPPEFAPSIHALFRVTASSLPTVASDLRKNLHISLEQQFSFRTSEAALKAWRHALETLGIFAFKDSFQDRFISGFCLLSRRCPIIMLNNSNSFTRQIFTVAHELGHILLGIHGVTDIDETYLDFMSTSDRRAETACNRFAAELLVPLSAFQREVRGLNPKNDSIISDLAERFAVSREVILRRCIDAGLVDADYYRSKVSEWNQDYLRRKPKTPGGDWYLTQLSYLGEGFTRLAFDRYGRGEIGIAQLASHLNVKARNIRNLRSYLGW